MRFAESIWLLGMFGALGLGLLLGLTAFRQSRALASFAQKAQLDVLVTSRPTIRRTLAGILLIAAVALAFLAAASPQYGKGTRILPRTNLDVVIVLDFSKSMYARDISPSRIERSKIEVQRLVQKLAGARFGAVAFAGEPMAFPLTSDGAAIAQFFVGLSPNDMPVGGTSTARAIEAGRQLLLRDPLAKNHEQVMVLITDGEDLEGDPVESARAAQDDGISVSVVQIGGQSPEPIPDIDDHGQSRGFRKDSRGKPLTTHLSEDGERQLEEVASAGHGKLVKAGKGDTGIDEMAESLRKRMTDELSERVETVYADVFQYPLGLAVLLLVVEVFVGLGKRRPKVVEPPRDLKRKRRLKRLQMQSASLVIGLFGCQPYDHIFERKSPIVEEAILALSAGETNRATELLTKYLETGECQEGVIGVGARGRQYSNASFDLGLAFASNSKEQSPDPANKPSAPPPSAQLPGLGLPGAPTPTAPIAPGLPGAAPPAAPKAEFECALRLLAPIADAEGEPAALRARAYYLMGNIEANRQNYDAAVAAYAKGLRLVPGTPEGSGDLIGRDLAHNHAVALKLLEEKKKQEEEQKKNEEEQKKNEDNEDNKDSQEGDDEKKDDKDNQEGDDEKKGDKDNEKKDESKEPQKDDQEKKDDKGDQEGQKDQPKEPQTSEKENEEQKPGQEENTPSEPPEQAEPRPENHPSVSQDERVLDQLEQSPTLQQHTARQRAGSGRSGMEDK